MANWINDNHTRQIIDGVELINYKCSCGKGVFNVAPDERRIEQHNQIPHKCTHCGKLVYFTHPYPVVSVKGRKFVHWETIRGENLKN